MENSARSDLVVRRDGIKAMVCADQSDTSADSDVLNQLLTRIDSVLSLSTDVPTVASSVLDSLQRAYTYVHKITQARLVLGERSKTALNEFDAAFKKCLESRLEEEEQAREELDKCEQLAEEAIQEAKEGYTKLKEIELQESLVISLSELEQIESNARSIVSEEEETLTEDKEQFSSKVKAVDGLLVELKTVSDRCDVEYEKTVKELKAEDFLNRCRQERFDEHLVWLEMKESELETTTAEAESEEEKQSLIDRQTVVADQIEELERRLRIVVATLAVEEYFQHEGDQLYDESVEEYSQWRDELNSLCEQAEMSLQVMEIMNECVEHVMEDAREKNATWEQMKLTYLLQLRDALMTVASFHMMRVENCHENSTMQQQIQEDVKKAQDELAVTDKEIKTLKPQMKLDTLRERIQMQARRDGGSVEQVSRHYKHFREDNHEERSLGHKQKMSATSRVQKRRQTSITHQCKYCNKVFSRPANLQRHMLTHTGEKPHECSECHKKFTQLSTLRSHMLTHTGEKPHECSECHKMFLRLSNLQRHMLTHTGKKQHECSECHMKFLLLSTLRNHMLTHTREKPHECSECHKKFSQLGTLRRHMLTHTGKKPHECSECRKRFSQLGTLRRHMVTHTGEKQHKCIVCQSRFTLKEHLKRHMSQHSEAQHYQ